MSYTSHSRSNPCLICKGKKQKQRCSSRTDGSRAYCCVMGENDIVPGWVCTPWRTDDDRQAWIWEPEGGSRHSSGRNRVFSDAGPVATPEKVSRKTLTATEERDGRAPRSIFDRITDDVEFAFLRDPHALFVAELGLRLDAAKAMDWRPWRDSYGDRCWVVPEWVLFEGEIRQAGWNIRYPRGTKPAGRDKLTQPNDNLPDGYHRGVFRPTDWDKGPEGAPIFFNEGASGATTLKMLGLPVLGRNNNGWRDAPTIAFMLRQAGVIEAGRPLVVLADYDPDIDRHDPNDPTLFHFPGRWGARRAAAALARELGVTVRVAFVPPCKGKDPRDWFIENGATAPIPQLRDKFLAGLRWDMTVRPEDYDAVWALPCYQPNRATRPLSPVPCHGGDGASATAAPIPERDYSDLAQFVPIHTEEVPTLAEAGAVYRGRQANDASGQNPCESASSILLRNKFNWDLMEISKRCGKCLGCLAACVATNFTIVQAILAAYFRAGGVLHEQQFLPDEFSNFQRRFSRAKDDGPAPFGHFYLRFYQPNGTFYILTTLPDEGPPVSLAEALCEVRDALEYAVNFLEVDFPYSSSRNVAKKKLPKEETGFTYVGEVEPCSDEFRAEVTQEVDATIHHVDVAPDDAKTLSKRIYRKPGGWDIESNEWLQNRLLGFPVGDFTITLTPHASTADLVPCGHPAGPSDQWDRLPDDHPF